MYTKTIPILTSILVTAILISVQYSLAENQYHESKIDFDSASYSTKKMVCYDIVFPNNIPEENKKATIIVTDPDANKFNDSIDRIKVFVWSDTDPKGIIITAFETHVNSGVFEGTAQISEDQSTQYQIRVTEGDSIHAKYVDTSLPPESKSGSLEVTASSFVGVSCPPIERVPATSIGIFDKDGNQIEKAKVDQQIQIRSDLTNPTSFNQTFAYIVQIQNKERIMVSLSWLSGALVPSQAFSPSVSWIPSNTGNYTVNVFVWESISNPNALSPPLFVDLEVISNSTHKESKMITENFQCKPGYELAMKSRDNSHICVKPETKLKLISRGLIKDISNKNFLDKEIPANYVPDDFRISTIVNGLVTLDTQRNLLLPDTCSPPIEFKLDLSPLEKQQIWQSVKDNNFFELGDFSNKCGDLENCVRVLPEIIVTLNITANGKTHSVTHYNSYIKTKNDNFDKFESIIETVGKIVQQKNQQNNFTAPRCGLL